MSENFICKIASLDEMNIKWDYEIDHSGRDRGNWVIWKKQNMENYKKGYIIPYYGILNGMIICDATAIINSCAAQNSDGLVNSHTAYLSAFRTIPLFQGKEYFSKLFSFMIEDLINKGYTKVTVGVEKDDTINKARYSHYGFNEYIKSEEEYYPDGSKIDVDYYGKTLK